MSVDRKTLIALQKPRYQLNIEGFAMALDQLVEVRILVPQYMLFADVPGK